MQSCTMQLPFGKLTLALAKSDWKYFFTAFMILFPASYVKLIPKWIGYPGYLTSTSKHIITCTECHKKCWSVQPMQTSTPCKNQWVQFGEVFRILNHHLWDSPTTGTSIYTSHKQFLQFAIEKIMELPKKFPVSKFRHPFWESNLWLFFVGSEKRYLQKKGTTKHRTSPRKSSSPDLEEDKEEARRRVATSVVGYETNEVLRLGKE